jgi:dUTP pyrophosphatase
MTKNSDIKGIEVSIKRFDLDLPLPAYQTDGAAALDLYSREEVKIEPGSIGYIPLNIALQLPEGYWVMISARSSLHKRGLMLANGIGVGDWDYRGDNDEYKAALLNFSKEAVVVERGERIVQMIILSRQQVKLIETARFNTEDRGGYGSTGR